MTQTIGQKKSGWSKWLRVLYPGGKEVDIHIDSIKDEKVSPRLWKAKQEAIQIMEQYNFEFEVNLFPTLFFIITIDPFVTPTSTGTSFHATR